MCDVYFTVWELSYQLENIYREMTGLELKSGRVVQWAGTENPSAATMATEKKYFSQLN